MPSRLSRILTRRFSHTFIPPYENCMPTAGPADPPVEVHSWPGYRIGSRRVTLMTELTHQDHVDKVLDIVDTAEKETGTTMSVDPSAVDDRLETYDKKRLQLDDAVRVIAKQIIRDAGEDPRSFISGSSRGGGSGSNEQLTATDIVEPDRWIAFKATVIELSEPKADNMVQTGILADPTGSIRFTSWETSDGDDPIDVELEVGETYLFEPVVTNLWEDAGQMELKFRQVTEVEHIDEEEAFDIDPDNYSEQISGAIVSFKEPMGLVDRCPHAECGRVVEERDHCPDCGDIEADLDLRTKAVVDDGADTWVIILDGEQTTRYTDLTMEDAEELVREHSNRDVVRQYIESRLHGEFFHVDGMEHGRNFRAEQLNFIDPPSIDDIDTIRDRLAQLP